MVTHEKKGGLKSISYEDIKIALGKAFDKIRKKYKGVSIKTYYDEDKIGYVDIFYYKHDVLESDIVEDIGKIVKRAFKGGKFEVCFFKESITYP